VATITENVPGVVLLRDGKESSVGSKAAILAGDTLRVPSTGSATAEFADGSWIRLLEGAALSFAPNPLPSAMLNGDLAKPLVLHQGKCEAEFKAQAGARDVAIFTPHAIVEMSGGRVTLTLTPSSTRLDVVAGEVDIVREDDGLSTRVEPGHYTIISKGADPVVLPRD
jgi:ferric-dicitrate binding protein FerR (iron transport regulator)